MCDAIRGIPGGCRLFQRGVFTEDGWGGLEALEGILIRPMFKRVKVAELGACGAIFGSDSAGFEEI